MIVYKINFWKRAENDFLKLPKDIQLRITKKLTIAQEDPFLFFIRLKGRQDYKLRVGDYRVILDIKEDKLLIFVIEVGHRREISNNCCCLSSSRGASPTVQFPAKEKNKFLRAAPETLGTR